MSSPNSSRLGQLLRRLRTAAVLSQEELAERAGLSVRAVSDLERGVHRAPRLETVRVLAVALQLGERERAELLAAARPEVTIAPSAVSVRPPLLTELPRPPTRLIGREAEVVEIGALLMSGEHRLVTMTGPGGVGKTRVALEVAERLLVGFADGVAFVDLTPVRDAALVPTAVATSLGIREVGSQSIADQLAAYLRERVMVLVLDNFEQVLDAAPCVAELLAAAPGLRVLVTSREPLRLSAEQVVPVGPLALPVSGASISMDDPLRPEAVMLFIERAHAADPSFALTLENAATIARIVRRLDGLPLAIELAAARVRTLPPAALVTWLEQQSLRLLTGGPRDQPDRQRTMRDTIAWSYSLLSHSEQRLFRELSVFVGGFTLDAAEAVAMAPEEGELDVLDGVASLIDKSLVYRMSGFDDDPRFTMLETVREYGLEQLAASGDQIHTREAHVAWVITLAEQAGVGLEGREQRRWLKQLEFELPNLRAALGWLEQSGDAATRLRVACALLWFWYIRSHLREGRAWLERALADGDDITASLRARALFTVGAAALGLRDFCVALAFSNESMAVAKRIGDTRGVALAQFMLGMVPAMEGDYARSVVRFEESLAHWRQAEDRFWVAMTLTQLGQAVFGLPDVNRAAALHEEALVVLREMRGPWSTAVTLASLGNVVLEQGDVPRAEHLLCESLALAWDLDDQRFAGEILSSLAIAAERQGQFQRAARLIGAVDAVCDRVQSPLLDIPAQAARYEQSIDSVRTQRGEEAFAVARAAGRAMPLAEAIREAMAATPQPSDEPGHIAQARRVNRAPR